VPVVKNGGHALGKVKRKTNQTHQSGEKWTDKNELPPKGKKSGAPKERTLNALRGGVTARHTNKGKSNTRIEGTNTGSTGTIIFKKRDINCKHKNSPGIFKAVRCLRKGINRRDRRGKGLT